MIINIYFDAAVDAPAGIKSNEHYPLGLAVYVTITQGLRTLDFTKYNLSVYGGIGTNNIGEWRACVLAMATLKRMRLNGYKDALFTVRSDSMLVVNQFNNLWKIKSQVFIPFFGAAKSLCASHNYKIELQWVRRGLNTKADDLSKAALKTPRVKPEIEDFDNAVFDLFNY